MDSLRAHNSSKELYLCWVWCRYRLNRNKVNVVQTINTSIKLKTNLSIDTLPEQWYIELFKNIDAQFRSKVMKICN